MYTYNCYHSEYPIRKKNNLDKEKLKIETSLNSNKKAWKSNEI